MVESVRALPNIGGGLMHGHSGHDQWTRLGLAKLRPNPLKASAKFTFSLGVRHGTILSGVTPKKVASMLPDLHAAFRSKVREGLSKNGRTVQPQFQPHLLLKIQMGKHRAAASCQCDALRRKLSDRYPSEVTIGSFLSRCLAAWIMFRLAGNWGDDLGVALRNVGVAHSAWR